MLKLHPCTCWAALQPWRWEVVRLCPTRPSFKLQPSVLVGICIRREPGCSNIHIQKDFIYFQPAPTDTTPEESGWISLVEGENAAETYQVSTGYSVAVKLSNYAQPPSSTRRLLSNPAPVFEGFDSITLSDAAKEIYTGDTIFVRSSVYIVNFCGFQPSVTKQVGYADRGCLGKESINYNALSASCCRESGLTPNGCAQQMERMFYSGYGTPNLEDYHNTCSYGKCKYRKQDTRIYDGIEVRWTACRTWLACPHGSHPWSHHQC